MLQDNIPVCFFITLTLRKDKYCTGRASWMYFAHLPFFELGINRLTTHNLSESSKTPFSSGTGLVRTLVTITWFNRSGNGRRDCEVVLPFFPLRQAPLPNPTIQLLNPYTTFPLSYLERQKGFTHNHQKDQVEKPGLFGGVMLIVLQLDSRVY